MKLLLDEMISPRVARSLRERGYDVQAIKHDRPELSGITDREIVLRMAGEQRAIATNDVLDFAAIHDRMIAAEEHHCGLIFTFDDTLPRNKAAIPEWIETLARLLDEHRGSEPLRNRVIHLL